MAMLELFFDALNLQLLAGLRRTLKASSIEFVLARTGPSTGGQRQPDTQGRQSYAANV